MTKADLIAIIADKLKFPWARAELLVDVVFGCMEQSMSRGEKIEVCATCPNYPYTRKSSYTRTLRHDHKLVLAQRDPTLPLLPLLGA